LYQGLTDLFFGLEGSAFAEYGGEFFEGVDVRDFLFAVKDLFDVKLAEELAFGGCADYEKATTLI